MRMKRSSTISSGAIPTMGIIRPGSASTPGWPGCWTGCARLALATRKLTPCARQRGSSGAPLFAADFLDWLRENGHFGAISLRAIPEGRLVHPGVPLTIVRGPMVAAQLLETALLNHLNYQTLIATKAARIHQAARGQTVLEFGLRRAQDRAAIAGARAALIGGADFTSNVGISHVLGFDPKGTHAHSMIQAFMALGGSELDAFRAYAEVYPDDCLLLVDTINTLESGVPNAIRVFAELRRKGHRPVGVRLDSGDLAYLTVETALQLDAAGFTDAAIVLSNSLDELTIWQILAQIRDEARQRRRDPEPFLRRLVFGVGTNLITSRGAAALDGVYKLVAVRGDDGWRPAIKISETPEKTPIPVSNGPGASMISAIAPRRTCWPWKMNHLRKRSAWSCAIPPTIPATVRSTAARSAS